MREPDIFVLADTTLKEVVDQIRDDQWSLPMPPDFGTVGEPVTLSQVINEHAYDDAWVPDMLAGRTMAEVGANAYRGDLLGADAKRAFAAIVDRACAAAAAADDLDQVVHCSFGDYPAREYFWQINGFRGLRAHDIAKAIGVSTDLPPELVAGLWESIEPNAEEWRSYGVFGPRVEVPTDASLQDKLLGLTGRQPGH